MDEYFGAFSIGTGTGRLSGVTTERLEKSIDKARRYLLGVQDPVEGFWVDQLEADATIPSEYLLFRRYLGRVDRAKELKLVRYIKSIQMEDGGWYIYRGGPSDISATVKAYFALKVAGVSPDEPCMVKARENVLARGGLVNANVFTKITLSMFGQYDWAGLPCMPAELMLLPEWFYFNIYEVSYWSRTVMVPLLIIFAKKPLCKLPDGMGIEELYLRPTDRADCRKVDSRFKLEKRLLSWKNFFLALDAGLRLYENHRSDALRARGVTAAYKWMAERMKGSGGLGAAPGGRPARGPSRRA